MYCNKSISFALILFTIVLLPTSCKIEKRKYNRGFYISHFSKKKNKSQNTESKIEISTYLTTNNSPAALSEQDENKIASSHATIDENEKYIKNNYCISPSNKNKMRFSNKQTLPIKVSSEKITNLHLKKKNKIKPFELNPLDFYSNAKGNSIASIIFLFTLFGWPLYILFLCFSEYWASRYLQNITDHTSKEFKKIRKIKRLNLLFLIISSALLSIAIVTQAVYWGFEGLYLLLLIPSITILLYIISKKLGSSKGNHGSPESKSANHFFLSAIFLIAFPLYIIFFCISMKNANKTRIEYTDKNSNEYKKAKLIITLNWILFSLWAAVFLTAAILISLNVSALFLLILLIPLSIFLPVYFGNKKR